MATVDARERFQALIERHRGIVFKVANSYCRNAEDRGDLVQDISAQAWKAFASWDAARPFSTWLYRIALNVAISALRRQGTPGRQPLALDELAAEPGHDDDDARETDDGLRALARCIARLDPLNRALLVLYLDEKSQREIAEILGLSETNVATRIGRLKARLRADLAPNGTR
ncbi:MAG: sigma-70 family RNA polymerase sigma factor [Rhodanobacteraceae bacterium]|jgi:RNA polymerase sigma-70 factor (ECF subfamily)|nr:sigma-70 family RNA polymerase sigma factor [Rhodanobacteraceae bacterium]